MRWQDKYASDDGERYAQGIIWPCGEPVQSRVLDSSLQFGFVEWISNINRCKFRSVWTRLRDGEFGTLTSVQQCSHRLHPIPWHDLSKRSLVRISATVFEVYSDLCRPLYPTCDVLVPHTRSVKDMLAILGVLTQEDRTTEGDFWREQTFVEIPNVERPLRYLDIVSQAENRLRGKRIAVPKMYTGGHDPKAKPTIVSEDVIKLWQQARADLEALGASVMETDFPLVTNYEDDSVSGQTNNVEGFKSDWNSKERGELVAYLWDDFLKANNDPNYAGLGFVDGRYLFPRPQGYIPDRYLETKNFLNYPRLVELARNRKGKSIWEIDGMAEALPALEAQRKRDLEDWMDANGIDLVVFPANGDVGEADVDTNDASARHALQNGVKYSNGNRSIRHMGVPTVSVPMGMMATSRMPVNLTFAGKCGQDIELLKYAYEFEQHTMRRFEPPVTPALDADTLPTSHVVNPQQLPGTSFLSLVIDSAKKTGTFRVQITGRIQSYSIGNVQLEAFVDGQPVPGVSISRFDERWSFITEYTPFEPAKPVYGGFGQLVGTVNLIVLARSHGIVAGRVVTIDQNAPVETQQSTES